MPIISSPIRGRGDDMFDVIDDELRKGGRRIVCESGLGEAAEQGGDTQT